MNKIQDAVLEAIEATLTGKGFQPLISWRGASSGGIYVSFPAAGGALKGRPAFNIAFEMGPEEARFQTLPPSETPRIWPQGSPDVRDDFRFRYQDREALDSMLEKIASQLRRMRDL
jgi:hypothetical protein